MTHINLELSHNNKTISNFAQLTEDNGQRFSNHDLYLKSGKTFRNGELNSPVCDDFVKHTLKLTSL